MQFLTFVQFLIIAVLQSLVYLLIFPIMYAIATPFILLIALRSSNYREGVKAGYERVKSFCESLWWLF